jgi:nitrogen regulatory protein P-II 1
MRKIEAIVRSERMPVVKEHLREIGIDGMTISTVSGWSKQRELHLQWRGQPIAFDLLPRAKFEIVIPDSQLESVIRAITRSARTGDKGEHGDGIIFISTVDQVINIAVASDYGDRISS